MLAKAFMVLITAGGEGDVGGAFAVQKSMKICETKIKPIVQVIESSGSKMLRSGCYFGEWPISSFSHGGEKPEENSYYLVDFTDSEKLVVTPMKDAKACDYSLARMSMLSDKTEKSLYCAASFQTWALPEDQPENKTQ